MKKLTERSFDALKEQFFVLDEHQQRKIVGGGYFDDYGIGYYDPEGAYHWVRTREDDGSGFSGNSWSSVNSSSGPSASGLFDFDPLYGYGTIVNPLSKEDYNKLVMNNQWHGGYVKDAGFVGLYASSVEYGNALYMGGSSWAAYGREHYPVSENDFYCFIDKGSWRGGFVQGWGYISAETVILGSSGTNSGFDIDAAVKHLISNGSDKSKSRCAEYVREAIEAGGVSTASRPENTNAKYYDTFLPTIGFTIVSTSGGYTPQTGDVIVHEATEGHQYGHIAMYTGEQWISDFVQKNMYGGTAYEKANNYTILRWNP